MIGLLLHCIARIADLQHRWNCAAALLHDVGQLMSQQSSALLRCRSEPVLSKHDVIADREGIGTHLLCGLGCNTVRVDPNPREVVTEPAVEENAGACVERAAR